MEMASTLFTKSPTLISVSHPESYLAKCMGSWIRCSPHIKLATTIAVQQVPGNRESGSLQAGSDEC